MRQDLRENFRMKVETELLRTKINQNPFDTAQEAATNSASNAKQNENA